jgi:DNA-binding beta-propeller fold protein YncE
MRILMIIFACAPAGWGQAGQPPHREKTIDLPNVQGRIDHLSIDVKCEKLFVAALGNDTLEVLDVKIGKRVNTISQLKEPQGILYVPEADRLYVAHGDDGSVRVFYGCSYALLKTSDYGEVSSYSSLGSGAVNPVP